MSLLSRLRATSSPWKWLPLIIMLAPAIYLLVLFVRDLRARRLAKSGPARPRRGLTSVWRAFLRRTPETQRRALALFQPFIVLGEAGAGKSALVDRFIDWRGQAMQFQPSHVDDARLQIYRGAHALVQELSAPLLEDSAPATRTALRRLWRLSVRGRVPEVVIALDVGRLMRATPEQLTRRAQVIRGKLDILAELLRRPIDVTLVVTKADQLSGYNSLAALLRPCGGTLLVHPPATGAPELVASFARFEEHLPSLLSSAPADAYLQALAFFDKLPALLEPLDGFVRVLGSADSIAPAPIVRSVALASNEEPSGAGWSPFAATLTEAELRRFHPLRKHVFAAAAVAAVLALGLLSGFFAARARIEDGSERLQALLDAPDDGAARAAWLSALADDRRVSSHLLPGFFAGDEQFGEAELHRRFVSGVRQRLLEPALGVAQRDKPNDQRLYALSLLRASNVDRLGRFIVAHAAQWAQGTSLPAWLVRDYVAASDPALAPPYDARELTVPTRLTPDFATPELAHLVSELSRRVSQPSMSPAELRQLAELAAPARRDAAALVERENLTAAVALMSDETGVELTTVWPRPDVSVRSAAGTATPAAVQALATLIDNSQLDGGDTGATVAIDLAGLVARLTTLAAQKPASGPPITLAVDGQSATIDPAAWDRLLTRSRVALLSRAFSSRANDGTAALFANAGDYAPITVAMRGDGCSFDGAGRIEGVYTAQAIANHLAPALTQLPDLLTKLPLDQTEKEQLSDRIVELVGGYADEYAEQYRALMTSLRCKARSPSELRWLATQLPASGSPLRAALREVARNTALTLPHDNPFSAPLEAVSDEFAALRALAPATGPATQLDGWVVLLRGMQAALDGRGAPLDKEPDSGLRARLTPVGRLALSIYRGDEDSLKLQLERWFAAANLDTDWWPPFAAPVDAAYALGRRELQTALAAAWDELDAQKLQPLAETFPFKRDIAATASSALLDALAPKQAFWSAFDATLTPVLIEGRDGWQAREGRGSTLLPRNLLSTIGRLGRLTATLWDKDGKPKPILVQLRPLPLTPVRGGRAEAAAVLASYLSAGGNTVYGFNQRADWTTVKIEWWHAESAAVGVAVGVGDAGKSYRALSVMDQPWSLWRLLLRANSDDGHVFTWQVPGPEGRTLPVQFEIKEEPWTYFALR